MPSIPPLSTAPRPRRPLVEVARVLASCLIAASAVAGCGDEGTSPGGGGGGGNSFDDPGQPSSSGGTSGSSGNGASSGNGGSSGSGAAWSSAESQGIATWYDANGTGSCSYDPGGEPLRVVALDSATYATASWCGACVDVDGPNGSVRVRVVDQCPDCQSPHLDLSPDAFAEIAESLQTGRVPIRFRFVACEASSPVRYRYKEGSSRWWTAIQVLNHKLPLRSLEYRTADGGWQAIERLDYNYFVKADGVGPQPDGLTLRLTAIDGQTLVDTLPAFADEAHDTVARAGAAQFQ